MLRKGETRKEEKLIKLIKEKKNSFLIFKDFHSKTKKTFSWLFGVLCV